MSLVKFENFSGRLSEDIVKWRKALDRNFESLEWNQRRRARYIPILFSEKALRYYESLPETTTRNYKSVLDAFEKKFSKKIRGALQVNSLLDRRQLPSESVESYARAMNDIFDKYEVTDEYVKMTSFVRGLKSTIRQDLLKQRPSNLDQCEGFAQIIEAADLEAVRLPDAVNDPLSMLNTRAPITQFRQGYANSKPFCQRCNTRHTFGRHTRRLPPRQPQRDSNGQNLNMHPQGVNPASPTPIPYHTRQPSFNRPPFHPTNQPNYTGKVPSHPRLNPTKGSVGLVTCFQCSLPGHKKFSCEKVRINISSSSMLKTKLVAPYYSLPSIALLDSGSQANLISERKLNQLSRLCGYRIRR